MTSRIGTCASERAARHQPRTRAVCPRLRLLRRCQQRERQHCMETAVCASVPRWGRHRALLRAPESFAVPFASKVTEVMGGNCNEACLLPHISPNFACQPRATVPRRSLKPAAVRFTLRRHGIRTARLISEFKADFSSTPSRRSVPHQRSPGRRQGRVRDLLLSCRHGCPPRTPHPPVASRTRLSTTARPSTPRLSGIVPSHTPSKAGQWDLRKFFGHELVD